jgi:flagellar capping protein FliD
MATYSSKYIPNFATITAPLRNLTKKNAKFEWTKTHQNAYDQLTSALSSAKCMAYFSKHKDTFITVDASPVGLSAIPSQKTKERDDDEKVIAYESRAVTDTEMRYSQTEKEALAIVWGVEHFHLYVYGHEFVFVNRP